MKKKISKIAYGIFCMVMLIAFNTRISHAERKVFNIEQAVGNPPEITAYVNGEDTSEDAEYIASLKGSDKTFDTESIKQFKKAGKPVRYVVFLDNSKSVDESEFKEVKRQLVRLRKNLREKDKMELYTVGSDSKRGDKKEIFKSEGNDKKIIKKDIDAIEKIKRDKDYTVLYRSITKKLTTIDNSADRTLMLLITDGEDDSEGKDKENYNVNPAVKSSKVPVYGILLKNVSSKPDVKKIENTKKNVLNEKISRGYCRDCASVKDVKKGFEKINDIVFKETYVVSFKASDGSNKIVSESESKLSIILKKSGKTKEALLDKEGSFSYTNSIPDNDIPQIKAVKKTGDNSLEITIKDGTTKKLCGAEDKENYVVKTAGKGGKTWSISDVSSNAEKGTYTLIFKDKLYRGKYTLECKNITDDSQEANMISDGSFKFKIKSGINGNAEAVKSIAKSYWWLLLIGIVAVIGVVMIIILKKKSVQVVEVKTEDPMIAGSKLIRLTVTDMTGQTKDMEWDVEGSIFVGRSNICNIYFDDDMLSRQHFVIEATKMACYIEDLETTNSTFVNGVKMTGKRKLSEGDIITAGREKFVFHEVMDGGDGE